MAISAVIGWRIVFVVLACTMATSIAYTIAIDGSPFRTENFSRLMVATIIDIYISTVAIATWISYKEPNWIASTIWIVFLVCLGRKGMEQHRKHSSVMIAKKIYSVLGCLMAVNLVYLFSDGWPFRKEIFTPWMVTTLIDYFILVTVLSIWMFYKEESWLTAIFWIVLVQTLGSSRGCSRPSTTPRALCITGSLMASSAVIGWRILFILLGCTMVATLGYTLATDGSPFRRELLSRLMVVVLIDFYFNVIVIAAWVCYKESNWIAAAVWIVFLVCLGSIATCAYILWQLWQLSSQESFEDIVYNVLIKNPNNWMVATLIDFYINGTALSVWMFYKEESWLTALLWIALFIIFGSASSCPFIVKELFKLNSEDPAYLVLFKNSNRQENMLGVVRGHSLTMVHSPRQKEDMRERRAHKQKLDGLSSIWYVSKMLHEEQNP
ncbi:hypothetical protein SDJN02_21502 [Cucurbita argyrosperma subsp. argyrosperma]|nr:hypothetical protein SDJN02_21502 [Cucurbita argyrosperma subsp. argyrosperma]